MNYVQTVGDAFQSTFVERVSVRPRTEGTTFLKDNAVQLLDEKQPKT